MVSAPWPPPPAHPQKLGRPLFNPEFGSHLWLVMGFPLPRVGFRTRSLPVLELGAPPETQRSNALQSRVSPGVGGEPWGSDVSRLDSNVSRGQSPCQQVSEAKKLCWFCSTSFITTLGFGVVSVELALCSSEWLLDDFSFCFYPNS